MCGKFYVCNFDVCGDLYIYLFKNLLSIWYVLGIVLSVGKIDMIY